MYGVLVIKPKMYYEPGKDDDPSTQDLQKLDGIEKLEYKIKIKSDLVSLFMDCDSIHSKKRKQMLEVLKSNDKDFNQWYNTVNYKGQYLSGSVGWYGRKYFFIGIEVNIILEDGDIKNI
ncbi:MAG: hypothetical protein SPF22_07545 [Candidatus Onthovivens sp.]|nr:hypothetical protein [Candidatus Onthovivens sp.]